MTVRRRRRPRRSIVRRLCRAAALALLILVVAVLSLRWVFPPVTSFMAQRMVAAWWSGDWDFIVAHHWVPWEGIAPSIPLAVVASEDQKYPDHRGFDIESITQAWSARGEGRLRGASTISQQVAKNLFLWSGRTFVRKGLEAALTVLLEASLPKRRILEIYLNVAEFGDGIFGVGAATQAFFGKPPARVSAAEAALLAAILPSPSRLHADRPTPFLRERQDWILSQMQRLGGPAYLAGL